MARGGTRERSVVPKQLVANGSIGAGAIQAKRSCRQHFIRIELRDATAYRIVRDASLVCLHPRSTAICREHHCVTVDCVSARRHPSCCAGRAPWRLACWAVIVERHGDCQRVVEIKCNPSLRKPKVCCRSASNANDAFDLHMLRDGSDAPGKRNRRHSRRGSHEFARGGRGTHRTARRRAEGALAGARARAARPR